MTDSTLLMIIDDDRDDRIFFRNAVKKIGPHYAAIESPNAIDALQTLRSAEILPHYIFLDLNMPMMNGKECLIELKKDPLLQNIPVIIYSTSNYSEDMQAADDLGASYYLVKVWDITDLPAALIEAMRQTETGTFSKSAGSEKES